MKKCGASTEVYSRVTGYFRPLKNWNAGKQEEYRNRVAFGAAVGTERGSEREAPRPPIAEKETCACS